MFYHLSIHETRYLDEELATTDRLIYDAFGYMMDDVLFWILRRDYLVSLRLTADSKLHISFVPDGSRRWFLGIARL